MIYFHKKNPKTFAAPEISDLLRVRKTELSYSVISH